MKDIKMNPNEFVKMKTIIYLLGIDGMDGLDVKEEKFRELDRTIETIQNQHTEEKRLKIK